MYHHTMIQQRFRNRMKETEWINFKFFQNGIFMINVFVHLQVFVLIREPTDVAINNSFFFHFNIWRVKSGSVRLSIHHQISTDTVTHS